MSAARARESTSDELLQGKAIRARRDERAIESPRTFLPLGIATATFGTGDLESSAWHKLATSVMKKYSARLTFAVQEQHRPGRPLRALECPSPNTPTVSACAWTARQLLELQSASRVGSIKGRLCSFVPGAAAGEAATMA